MTLGLCFAFHFFNTFMTGQRNDHLVFQHRYFTRCYDRMHLPQPYILAKPHWQFTCHRTVCVLPATGQQASVEATVLSARRETALALTTPKLAEREFPRPAWLISRAASAADWVGVNESRCTGLACVWLKSPDRIQRWQSRNFSKRWYWRTLHAKGFHPRVYPPQPRGWTSWGQLRRPLLDKMKM